MSEELSHSCGKYKIPCLNPEVGIGVRHTLIRIILQPNETFFERYFFFISRIPRASISLSPTLKFYSEAIASSNGISIKLLLNQLIAIFKHFRCL